MTMKRGAAMAAAANRITAANRPATLKITSERQYWARLMRPLEKLWGGRRRSWQLHRPYEPMEVAPWPKSMISAEA